MTELWQGALNLKIFQGAGNIFFKRGYILIHWARANKNVTQTWHPKLGTKFEYQMWYPNVGTQIWLPKFVATVGYHKLIPNLATTFGYQMLVPNTKYRRSVDLV